MDDQTSSNVPYFFDSMPMQLNTMYQLCDIRLRSIQIIVNDQNNIGRECTQNYGWFDKQILERIRTIMKRKVEEWLEKGGDNEYDDDVMEEGEEVDEDTGGTDVAAIPDEDTAFLST